MKLSKAELQFLLDFANNAKSSDINYFLFDSNNDLNGVKNDAPDNIKLIFEKFKNLEGRN